MNTLKKQSTFSVEEIFAGGKGMCIEIKHDLAWGIYMCICKICMYNVRYIVKLVIFKVKLIFWLQRTFTWKTLGERKCFTPG